MADDQKALGKALNELDDIIFSFEGVLKQDFDAKKPVNDFEGIAGTIIRHRNAASEPLKKPEPALKPVEKHVLRTEQASDPRLSMDLCQLEADSHSCTRCGLCKTRKNVVFGTGCTDSPLVMVVGEGPGENEDKTGLPFVGNAGQFLDKWLASISLSRDTNTYITNIVKCRPPMNRDPQTDEKQACVDYLKAQISLLRPKAILCLGKPASTLMTGLDEASMGSMRGRFFFYNNSIPMICTYHPAAVLRDLSLKRAVWDDLQKLAKFMNLEIMTAKK